MTNVEIVDEPLAPPKETVSICLKSKSVVIDGVFVGFADSKEDVLRIALVNVPRRGLK